MAATRFALVDSNNVVQNVVLWDTATTWTPPAGLTAVAIGSTPCAPGYTFNPANQTFTFGQTPDEILAANAATVLQRAQQALGVNATYLAIVSPTTAQAVAQVGALTRQVNGIIRTLLDSFSSISDT